MHELISLFPQSEYNFQAFSGDEEGSSETVIHNLFHGYI